MTQISSHVVLDERGVPYIEGTRMPVAAIAMERIRGATPEQIQASFPHLSLAHVYSALAYYYGNRTSMEEAIAKSQKYAQSQREEALSAGNQPTCDTLEKRSRNRGNNS